MYNKETRSKAKWLNGRKICITLYDDIIIFTYVFSSLLVSVFRYFFVIRTNRIVEYSFGISYSLTCMPMCITVLSFSELTVFALIVSFIFRRLFLLFRATLVDADASRLVIFSKCWWKTHLFAIPFFDVNSILKMNCKFFATMIEWMKIILTNTFLVAANQPNYLFITFLVEKEWRIKLALVVIRRCRFWRRLKYDILSFNV